MKSDQALVEDAVAVARFLRASTAVTCAAVWALLLIALSPMALAHDPGERCPHGEHDSNACDPSTYVPAGYPPPLGFSLAEGWLDPWPHSHFSRRGTPFVHLFNLEPAYLDRDLFFFYSQTREHDGIERELEIELEWAFTRRIGMALELPVVEIKPDEGRAQRGLGDLAIAPRLLLLDTPRFLLSGNLEMQLPTGSKRRGIGSGEVALAPFTTTWLDLGNWFSFQTEVGIERGLRSGHSELFYKGGLTYSFVGPAVFSESPRHRLLGHNHFPPGLTSLILEAVARTELSRENRGETHVELLFGAGYNITDSFELRGGYQLPVRDRLEIKDRFLINLIYHF
jgi:hypothetical protein